MSAISTSETNSYDSAVGVGLFFFVLAMTSLAVSGYFFQQSRALQPCTPKVLLPFCTALITGGIGFSLIASYG